MDEFRKYLLHVYRHLKLVLTGGVIALFLVLYALFFRQALPLWVVITILILSLQLASFEAWREQYLLVQAFADKAPRIDRIDPLSGAPNNGQLYLRIHLINPGEATSLKNDWHLRIETLAGRHLRSVSAGYDVRRPFGGLPSGGEAYAGVVFSFDEGTFTSRYEPVSGRAELTDDDRALLEGSLLVVRVSDIRGNRLWFDTEARLAL